MRKRITILLIKGIKTMGKMMRIFLAIGIIFLISGIIMAFLHVAPEIPAILAGFGGAMIGVYFYTRGGNLIMDEMVKRVDAVSAYYTYIATLCFIIACAIINYFSPLSASGLLLTEMIFMPLLFTLIRHYLLKRGKTE